jgi:hypothetical protein
LSGEITELPGDSAAHICHLGNVIANDIEIAEDRKTEQGEITGPNISSRVGDGDATG